MIDFYYWPTPNGWKVSILLEELGVDYNTIFVNIGQGDQFKPDFLKISPNNRMPAIVDHDADPAVPIFESGAIMFYLAQKYGQFLPSDPLLQKEVLEWLFWQTGNQGPMMGQHSHFFNYAPEEERQGYGRKRYEAESMRCLSVLNTRLEGRDWIVGDAYSIADMINFPWVLIAKAMQLPLDDYPHLVRWRQAVKERPAVQRGVALGKDNRRQRPPTDEERKILFGQKG
ncbi:MAG: glutathione S-transferase N-terminal domain-containing protein [Rhizobiaceae bacterium]|nr:glutathione S-transferase N-terminal domain-containing protein [Rhizobiaceae bacterium]